MEKFNRAVRRHHVERLKKARKGYWGFGSTWKPGKPSAEQLGILVNTPTPCSCWMCGYPRKIHGPTLQELSFNELHETLLRYEEEEEDEKD